MHWPLVVNSELLLVRSRRRSMASWKTGTAQTELDRWPTTAIFHKICSTYASRQHQQHVTHLSWWTNNQPLS